MSTLRGEVDLFGLDEFGNNPGMSDLKGLLIGVGAASAAKIIAKKFSSMDPNLAGFLVGGVTSAALYYNKGTRAAAISSAVATAAFTLLPWALGKLGFGELGLPQVEYLNGAMGLPQVEYLNGAMGMPGIAPVPPSYGTIPGVYGNTGFAGPQLNSAHPPVDLLGEKTARAEQVELMGGPALSGLAAAYGATLFGR